MISGGVHSGPVTAIRYVGYVGLLLFLILAILVAVHAARLIRRSRDTPYFTLALFLGIPSVWFPVHYVFIFGAFETDLPTLIITIGMQKMLENSLNAHQASRSEAPPVPIAAKTKIQRRRSDYAAASRFQ